MFSSFQSFLVQRSKINFKVLIAFSYLVLFFILGCSPQPNAIIRVDCGEFNNKGVQASLNGQFIGECPVDLTVHSGKIEINARKDNDDASYLFAEAKMTLAENAMKRIKLDIQPVYTEEYYYRKATDINGMQAYLEKQPDGTRRQEIADKIEQYYFDKTTDLAGMELYIKQLPDGERRVEVNDKIEEFYFDKTTDLDGMKLYVKELPQGKRITEVNNKIEQFYFDKATDLSGMQLYLKDLPNGTRVGEVKEKIEQYYFDSAVNEAGFNNYLKMYPNGKYNKQVTQQVNNLRQKEIKEEKRKNDELERRLFEKTTDIAGMVLYLSALPDGKNFGTVKEKFKNELLQSLEMANIPTGIFKMGCNEGDRECTTNAKPAHTVKVPSFKLSKTEITFAQYDVFAKMTKRALPGDEGWGRGNRPVINVTWHDAVAYTTWLSEQTGKKFRLPSEAEWEYAVRAGTASKYSWGDSLGRNNANCIGCARQSEGEKTLPVASFSPNAFGLYDMHGNVYEWTQDCWSANYNNAPTNGSALQTGDCNRRVARGGSWDRSHGYLRVWNRDFFESDSRSNERGFRVVVQD